MDQDETWYAGRPRPWPHCVRWGPRFPSPKGAQPPFLAYIYCGQMAGWITMPLGIEVGLGQATLWSMETQLPLPKKGGAPAIFGPCLLCPNGWKGQDVTWYRGGLGPGYIMLDGDASPPKKGHCTPKNGAQRPTLFGPYLLWPNGWMDQDSTWYRGRSRPGHIM